MVDRKVLELLKLDGDDEEVDPDDLLSDEGEEEPKDDDFEDDEDGGDYDAEQVSRTWWINVVTGILTDVLSILTMVKEMRETMMVQARIISAELIVGL